MNKLVDERGWHGFCRIYSCEVLWQKLNCYTNIMSVTNMMRILICCISLLSFMACNDAQGVKQCWKTRPVPGIIVSSRILERDKSMECIPKDTFSVVDDALFK